jgi:hypothetical protein
MERAGVTLVAPNGWRSAEPTRWSVPGTPLAAWSGPGGASLVVYRTLPGPAVQSSDLVVGLANRLENLPGLRVLSRRTETVAGLEAGWVEAVAPGTGDAFAPSGTGTPFVAKGVELKPTRRVSVTIPRAADTLTLVWHAPEADSSTLEASVRETLSALKVDQGRLSTNTY